MNKYMNAIWRQRSAKFDLAIIAAVITAFVVACGGSSAPKKPIPSAYVGSWTGTDGSKLNIRADNTGDYYAGSTKVEGGAVEIDETAKQVKFTMLGVDVGKYTIDTPPSGSKMKLNGVDYTRAGGGSDTTSTTTTTTKDSGNKSTSTDSTTTGGETVSESEAERLAGSSLQSFNEAIQEGDFETFVNENIATKAQEQITPEKMKSAFAQFIEKKIDLTPKSGSKPTFSPKPAVDGSGLLNLSGSYPTAQGTNANFDMKYMKDAGDWKLVSINVRTSAGS